MSRLLVALLLLSADCHAANPWDLCKAEEKLVFGCSLEKKVAAICASSSLSPRDGYAQYRFGTPGRIELAYPTPLVHPDGHFFFSHADYSGGDNSRMRFKIGTNEYTLFHSTTRTGFGADGLNNPQEAAGIFTTAKGKARKPRKCLNFVGFSEVHVHFQREEWGAP